MRDLDARKILQVGQKLTLLIDNFNASGQGVAHYEDITIFVSGSLPNELVQAKLIQVKKTYAVAVCLEVLQPAQQRNIPTCPHYGLCGSCQLQHMSYAYSLVFKRQKVIDALCSITKLPRANAESLVQATLASPKTEHYRNKVVYNFAESDTAEAGFKLGFYAPKSHNVVDLLNCPAEFSDAQEIRKSLRDILSQVEIQKEMQSLLVSPKLFYCEEDNTGLFKRLMLRHSDYEQKTLLTFVLNLKDTDFSSKLGSFFARISAKLAERINLAGCFVNLQPQATNRIYNNDFRIIYGEPTIKERLRVCGCDFIYEVGAADFFQINPSCASLLFTQALNKLALTGTECVYDLYCGTGSISLPLASCAKEVIGIEIVESAIEHAKRNQALNGLSNIKFLAGDASILFPKLFAAGHKADAVLVDPPRKGLDEETIKTILKMQPQKLLYVSCDSGSLARDLNDLLAFGTYSLQSIQPIDMFPGSNHVETVVLLSRVTPTK